MTDSIVKTVTVPLSPERAFRLFTEEISDWWPLDTYSLSGEDENVTKSIKIVPNIGGDVTETRHDGSTESWGRVTEWEPGKRFGMRWHLGHPESEATQVEVRFDVVANGTRVTLVHSGWQDLGKNAVAMRNGYEAGWQGLLVLHYETFGQMRFLPASIMA